MQLLAPNKTLFMQPEHTPPSAWIGHIPFAGWLVEALQPTMIVELGTHHGTSYLAFCQAVQSNGLACRCFAVDTWEGDEHAGVYGESVYAQLHGYHALKYAGFSRLMRMTFDAAVEYFDDESIDLLHIDGLHTYEAVLHDFETWLPKMSRKGIVLFHDTCVREREFGVWRFWSEVSTKYPSFEFTHSHGLGVLAVGVEIPPPLSRLLHSGGDQSADERLLVRLMTENLGRTIDTDAEIRRLNHALAHEQALRREGGAAVLAKIADVVRENVDFVRGDIVHAENLLLAGQTQTDTVCQSRLTALEEAVTGVISTGVDALRRDLVAVRTQFLEVTEDATKQQRLVLEQDLNALGQDIVAALMKFGDVVHEKVDCVRGDIVHAQNLLMARQSESDHLSRSDLSALEEAVRGDFFTGVDALRHDLVAVRSQLLDVTHDTAQEHRQGLDNDLRSLQQNTASGLKDVLQAVGQSVEELRTELMARISSLQEELRDREIARDALIVENLADLSNSFEGSASRAQMLVETTGRLEEAIIAQRNRGLGARWRRMTGQESRTT